MNREIKHKFPVGAKVRYVCKHVRHSPEKAGMVGIILKQDDDAGEAYYNVRFNAAGFKESGCLEANLEPCDSDNE